MAVQRSRFAPPSLARTIRDSITRLSIYGEPFLGIRSEPSPRALSPSESPDLVNWKVSLGRMKNWSSHISKTGYRGSGFPRFITAGGQRADNPRAGHVFVSYSENTNASSASQVLFFPDDPDDLDTTAWSSMAIASDASINFRTQVSVGGAAELAAQSGQIVIITSEVPGTLSSFPVCWFPLQNTTGAQASASVNTLPNSMSTMSGAQSSAFFDDRLVFGHIWADTTRYPRRVLWTARGTVSNFTSASAGYEDLVAMRGEISAYLALDDRMLIFSDKQLWHALARRDTDVFDFDVLENSVGVAHDQLVCRTPYGVFWIFKNQLYRLVGNAVRKVALDLTKKFQELYTFIGVSGSTPKTIDPKAVTYNSKENVLHIFIPTGNLSTKMDVYAVHLDTITGDRDNPEADDVVWTKQDSPALTTMATGTGINHPKPMVSLSDDRLTVIDTPLFAVREASSVTPGLWFWRKDEGSARTLDYQTPVIMGSKDPRRLENIYEVDIDYESTGSQLSYFIGVSTDLGASFTTSTTSGSLLTTTNTLQIPFTHGPAAQDPILKITLAPVASGAIAICSLDRVRVALRSWTGGRR